MKSLHSTFRFAVLFFLALAACAPGSTPASTPSLVPIDLAGPEMKLGSSWLYADGSLLVPVPAGIFTMGGDKPDNAPHPVNLSEYWIYRTKVTNAQYAYCVGLGECTPPFAHDNPGFSDYLHASDPVVGVDWQQASDYCAFAHARLPTEAEWEKAARGPDAAIYPWGNGAPSCDLLNFDVCVGGTTPVNQYAAGQSYYHAFDMEGNAFEWAADWYGEDYYLSAPADDPQGPEKGRSRVVRSSGFNSGGNQTQTFNRFFSGPADHRDNLGFRCVVDDPDYFSPFCELPPVYGTDGIGGAPTGQGGIKVDCPVMSIDQNPTCKGNLPVTIVTLDAILSADILANGQPFTLLTLPPTCAFVEPGTFSCTKDGQIKLCGECRVTLTVPPQCPDSYTYDAASKTCVGTGTPGACLPGSTPATTPSGGACCTFEPDTAAPTADPLSEGFTTDVVPDLGNCPPGTWRYFAHQPPPSPYSDAFCIAAPVPSPYCYSESIALLSCTSGGGGGGGNTCNITDQSCANTCAPTGYIFDAAACSCNCNPG